MFIIMLANISFFTNISIDNICHVIYRFYSKFIVVKYIVVENVHQNKKIRSLFNKNCRQ